MGGDILFTTSLQGTGIALLNNLVFVALAGYLIILAWVLLVGYGLFIDPVKDQEDHYLVFQTSLSQTVERISRKGRR